MKQEIHKKLLTFKKTINHVLNLFLNKHKKILVKIFQKQKVSKLKIDFNQLKVY